MKPVNATINRVAILKEARRAMRLMSQWEGLRDFSRASHNQAAAESLIAIVEMNDCGAVGGYDKERGQPSPWRLPVRERLEDRLAWLERITPKEDEQ